MLICPSIESDQFGLFDSHRKSDFFKMLIRKTATDQYRAEEKWSVSFKYIFYLFSVYIK